MQDTVECCFDDEYLKRLAKITIGRVRASYVINLLYFLALNTKFLPIV